MVDTGSSWERSVDWHKAQELESSKAIARIIRYLIWMIMGVQDKSVLLYSIFLNDLLI